MRNFHTRSTFLRQKSDYTNLNLSKTRRFVIPTSKTKIIRMGCPKLFIAQKKKKKLKQEKSKKNGDWGKAGGGMAGCFVQHEFNYQ